MVHRLRINFELLFWSMQFIGIFSNEPIQTTENSENKVKLPISSDELLHRRKILESYLAESAKSRENWVETYNVDYSEPANDIETVYPNPQYNKPLSAEIKEVTSNVPAPFNNTTATFIKSYEVAQEFGEDVIKDRFTDHAKKLLMYKTDNANFEQSDNSKNLREMGNLDPIITEEKYLEYKTSLYERPYLKRNIKALFGIKDQINENMFCPINDIKNIASKSSQYLIEITSEQIETEITEVRYKSRSLKQTKIADSVLIKDHLQHQSRDLQHRHKILNSYKSKFGEDEDWVETYDAILKPNTNGKTLNHNAHLTSTAKKPNIDYSMTKNHPIEVVNKINKKYFTDCAQVRLYVTRWLKKLSNKFENTEQKFISFSLSSKSLIQLKELSSSENFDIVSVDEFMSNLISNFNIQNGYSGNEHDDYSWSDYIPSYKYMVSVVSVATVLFVAYSARKNPFVLITFAVILIIISSITINYYKMCQKRKAAKHHILSSISSSHCVNTLTANSGIYDHFKEYFRRYYYHEDCKKYYESLMVDPENEIDLFMVIIDWISNMFFSVFYVFSEALNSCVKSALYDTNFYEKIVIILIFMFLMLMYFRYNIKLPFISLEPTLPVGSRAQDLNLNAPRKSRLNYLFSRILFQPSLNEIDDINENNADKVLNLKTDSFPCLTNTQHNPENTCYEFDNVNKNTLISSEQSQKSCGDCIETKVTNAEINSIYNDNAGLAENKICDFVSLPLRCIDIQCSSEQSGCESNHKDSSSSEEYKENYSVGDINIEFTQSTHVSEDCNNCFNQLPADCNEKVNLSYHEDIVIEETLEKNVFSCIEMQCNPEQSGCESNDKDSSSSEEYKENSVGDINIEFTQSTHVSKECNNCSNQLPADCNEKVNISYRDRRNS